MGRPIAVVISDIHFSLNTLSLASKSLKAALSKAEELNIPLIIAGDLQNDKAIIRAEVANELLHILDGTKVKVYILEGNHDKVNEKGSQHGLNYLRPYACVIDYTQSAHIADNIAFIPYSSNFALELEDLPPGIKILICHQGFKGAWMGDYIQDKTSIDPQLVKDYTVISGHYHRHQTIGTVTYIGSPYTITFGEANDGPKGFFILNDDGSYTREILKLRKHVIIEKKIEDLNAVDLPDLSKEDLIWLKISGSRSELQKIDKQKLGEELFGHSNYKLDLIVTDSQPLNMESIASQKTNHEVLDSIIDRLSDSEKHKIYLKELYREIIQG